ncbi:MAG: aminotransferase class III-fold pyridoxal phosphate-dependent enzyme [Armatimonadota bacterium]
MAEQDWEKLTDECIDKYRRYIGPGLTNLMRFGGFAAVEVWAEGAVVRDGFGREYIDCLGGYGAFSLGHRHPKVVAAIKDELDRLPASTRTFFNQAQAQLAELLAEITPGKLQYSFFCHSGAEAVEGALKAARAASRRPGVIAADGAFHGKTFGALSASGRDVFKRPFEPLVPGFVHVPYGDADAIEDAITDEIGAVILEPIQGEGGVVVPPDDYLPRVREICDRHGLVLILDEVQTGLGRTGKMLACQWWDVAPDIMCLAKALGGGIEPLGAFVGTPVVWDALFGENPTLHTTTLVSSVSCRAGIATIQVLLEEDLPARAKRLGDRLLQRLTAVKERHPHTVTDVRGRGLLVGVQLSHKDVGLLVIGRLVSRGVIVAYTFNNPCVIRFEPPLVITEEQLDKAVEAFDESLTDAESMLGDVLASRTAAQKE